MARDRPRRWVSRPRRNWRGCRSHARRREQGLDRLERRRGLQSNACYGTPSAANAGLCSSLHDAASSHDGLQTGALVAFVAGGVLSATAIGILLWALDRRSTRYLSRLRSRRAVVAFPFPELGRRRDAIDRVRGWSSWYRRGPGVELLESQRRLHGAAQLRAGRRHLFGEFGSERRRRGARAAAQHRQRLRAPRALVERARPPDRVARVEPPHACRAKP